MTLQQRERIGSIIRSVVVIAIALICAVPLYVIVINTFKSSAEMSMDPIGLPKTWNFENYTYAFGHLPIVNAFKNTIIVMTSNVGAKNITAADTPLGFDGSGEAAKRTEEERFARIKDAVMAELRQTFRPEFLNRIDEIIVFHQLTEENIRSIARRMLDTIGSRMAAQGITLQADDDAVAALAKDGFDARYGARPLRRTLQNEVEDVVAEQMLDGQLKSGDTAHIRLKDDKVVIEK